MVAVVVSGCGWGYFLIQIQIWKHAADKILWPEVTPFTVWVIPSDDATTRQQDRLCS